MLRLFPYWFQSFFCHENGTGLLKKKRKLSIMGSAGGGGGGGGGGGRGGGKEKGNGRMGEGILFNMTIKGSNMNKQGQEIV